MATLNIGMKVNRAITGATTVTANAVAAVTYSPTSAAGALSPSPATNTVTGYPPITRFFGPGQSIPASFNVTGIGYTSAPTYTSGGSITYSLLSGVELINTI